MVSRDDKLSAMSVLHSLAPKHLLTLNLCDDTQEL